MVGWLYAFISPITSSYGTLGVTTVVVTSVFVVLFYAPWLLRILGRSLKFQWTQIGLRPGLLAIGGFFIVSNILFLGICYGAGFDITRGHRYCFVYYPSIVILVGASLAPFIQPLKPVDPTSNQQNFEQVKLPFIKRFLSGRTFVTVVLLISFLGTQAIVNDLSHLKFYKANRIVDFVRDNSTFPVVIGIEAIVGDQPSVIGNEIVSVAWEVKQQLDAGISVEAWAGEPRFIVAEQNTVTNSDSTVPIKESLRTIEKPVDLWLLNIHPPLESEGCDRPPNSGGSKGSYQYTHYVCQ